MSYCSLKEAYGEEFYNQVNNNYHMGTSLYPNGNSSQRNPTRNTSYLPGARHGTNISRVKNAQNARYTAETQSAQDILTHRRSFNSVSGRRYEAEPPNVSNDTTIRAWGEVESNNYPSVDEMSPKEHLKKSLLRERPIQNPNYDDTVSAYEPEGYSRSLTSYKKFDKSPCQDYFYHLDTCKKCQHKLKKRVIRYFKALQKHNKTPNLLPGTKDMKTNQMIDNELFRDEDEYDIPYEPEHKVETKRNVKENVVENFQNPTNTRAIFLMVFGLFIIYTLDNSKKMLSQ